MKTATHDQTSREPDDDAGNVRLDPDSVLAKLSQTRRSKDGATNGPASNNCLGFRLAPKRPPGRANCKVRAFAGEIGRLHDQGYTFEAIREALADVGVVVSRSTVHREVVRLRLMSKPPATGDATPLPG